MNRLLFSSLFAVSLFGAASCNDSNIEDDVKVVASGKAHDSTVGDIDTKGYNFILDDRKFTTFRDHAGAPLLATIWGRKAGYNADAPFVQSHFDGVKPWLLEITKTFHKVHRSWAPSFEEMGFDACDDLGINDDWFASFDNGKLDFGNVEPEQCFAQQIRWPNPETQELESYRRTIEVSLPDYLTVNTGEPAAFPNGRVLHEQINSLMFAMAFLDQGGNCKADDGTVLECNLHTLWKHPKFLKQHNDVPFRGAEKIGEPARIFPFLADPHEL